MDQRASLSRGWILLAIGLVVTVGAVGYYLGANHAFGQPVAVMRPGFGHGVFGVGFLGFWLPVLVLAVLIGILVAATARPGGPSPGPDPRYSRGPRRSRVRGPPSTS